MTDLPPPRVLPVLWRDSLVWRVRLVVDRGEHFPDNRRYVMDGKTITPDEIRKMSDELLRAKTVGRA